MDQPESESSLARELRCSKCSRLLAKASEEGASLEIKCARCGELNSVLSSLSDQIMITDADGIILYVNGAVEAVTGYSLREILGNRPSLWGGNMPKPFYEQLWKTIKAEKRPALVKVTNKKKDGTLYDAILKVSPVFGIDGEITMFVGIESLVD